MIKTIKELVFGLLQDALFYVFTIFLILYALGWTKKYGAEIFLTLMFVGLIIEGIFKFIKNKKK